MNIINELEKMSDELDEMAAEACNLQDRLKDISWDVICEVHRIRYIE